MVRAIGLFWMASTAAFAMEEVTLPEKFEHHPSIETEGITVS